jgi:ABC-2 type transport system permease protein
MLGQIRPIVKKEFRQIKRDRRTLGMLLFLPGFLLIMYGYALNFDVKHLALAVVDQERSEASRDFRRVFAHSEYFDLKFDLESSQDVDRFMGQDKIQLAVVIPDDFSKSLLAGKAASVQVIVDGEETNIAGTAVGYINALAQSYSARIVIENLMKRGQPRIMMPFDIRPRVWYNPELVSARFLVPGLMAFILMIIVVISTSFSVVREKERGALEQIIVSPVKPAALIIGKTIPYAAVSLVSSHLVLLFGYLLFHVAVRGNYLLLLLGVFLFLICGLGLGLLISTIAHSQQVAFIISIVATLLPTFLLSGFIFPIRNMPAVIQAVTYLIPARYFLVILRGVMLKGVGIEAFWMQLIFLLIFAVVAVGVSSARLDKILKKG